MSWNDEKEYNVLNGEILAQKPKEGCYKHKKVQNTANKYKKN
jgi:hypothetical protein